MLTRRRWFYAHRRGIQADDQDTRAGGALRKRTAKGSGQWTGSVPHRRRGTSGASIEGSQAILELSEAARLEDASRFARQLDLQLSETARDHGALLIATPAVVAGAPALADVLRAPLEAQGNGTGERRGNR